MVGENNVLRNVGKIPTIMQGVTSQYTAVFVVGLRPHKVTLANSVGELVVKLLVIKTLGGMRVNFSAPGADD
jgi:hypothetical protein